MMGRFCRLERLDVERHVADLWAANSLDCEARMWTYLPDSGRSTSAAGTRPDATIPPLDEVGSEDLVSGKPAGAEVA